MIYYSLSPAPSFFFLSFVTQIYKFRLAIFPVLSFPYKLIIVFMQYSKFVKPAFDDFILPTKKYADIIIPRGGDNHVAIDLIVQHIRTKLGQHDLCKIYPNLYVIQSTFQVSHLSYFLLSYIIITLPCLLVSGSLLVCNYCLSHADTGHAYPHT